MSKNFQKYTDSELHYFVKKNNERSKAYEAIFDRYSKFAIAFIRATVKNEDLSKEIFQETFIRLYHQLLEKDELTIPGMITTISRNLFYNVKRDTKDKVDIDTIDVNSWDGNLLENKELLELILNAVEFLEEKYRTIFILRELNGHSFKEIAEIEDISLSNAKLRATRAKRKIIQILKPYILDLERN